MSRTIGAFIFPTVWEEWDREDATRILKSLKAFGVNSIATESETYRDDVIDVAHSLDMRFVGGIAHYAAGPGGRALGAGTAGRLGPAVQFSHQSGAAGYVADGGRGQPPAVR